MSEIRILLYTDTSHVGESRDDVYGIYFMCKAVEAKRPPFVQIRFSRRDRHQDEFELTLENLVQFDELWVFGMKVLNEEGGKVPNELTAPEIEALRCWMKTGGVLVTGDHADPVSASTDPKTFMSLGRAIGKGIPRAGELRVWEGPPTAIPESSFNTQSPSLGYCLDSPHLESDAEPQRLVLERVNGNVHPLFWNRVVDVCHCPRFEPILDFPDHTHEGALRMPVAFPPEVWPGTARPQVVANGTDKRTGALLPIVMAYDGGASTGRIVADSTWHHYFNINLRGFPMSNDLPIPGTPYDAIAQFYVNLALWLAPKAVRDQFPVDLLSYVARNPRVLEVARSGPEIVGLTASAVIEQEIGVSDFLRVLLAPDFDEEPGSPLLKQMLVHEGAGGSVVDIAMLGRIVVATHGVWREHGILDPFSIGSSDDKLPPRSEVVGRALLDVIRESKHRLEETAAAICAAFGFPSDEA